MFTYPSDNRLAAAVQKKLHSRSMARRSWLFSGPVPSSQAFDLYGICGDCRIACKRGMVRVKKLRQSDAILTRKHGYTRPLAIRFANGLLDDAPRTGITLAAGAFGDGFPQESVGLGRGTKILRYVAAEESRRPQIVSASHVRMTNPNSAKDCDPSNLCVVIFEEPVEVQIGGLYIKCPSFETLETPNQ